MESLSHSGKELLSGMNTKDTTVLDAAVAAYLADGGVITKVKPKKIKRHNLQSKSHSFWGSKS